MTAQDSATRPQRIAVAEATTDPEGTTDPGGTPAPHGSRRTGTVLAALSVTAFSLTFPATAWGLEGIGPWSLVTLRGALSALIAGGCLLALRVPVPHRRHWAGLVVVGAGVVVGFPLLTTLALQTSTTAHAAVVVGLLPLTTAVFSALRTGRAPPARSGRRRSPGPPPSSRSPCSRAAARCPPPTSTSSARC